MSNKSYHSKENNLVMIQGGEKKVMKKILSVALSTAMAFSMFASVAFGDTAALTPQQKFDVLKEAKVVTGYPDGSAHLEKDLTRAEFAKVVSSLMGLKPITGQLSFKDKGYTAKNWAVPYIEAVYSAGLMEGKNTTKKIFDYNGKITVQEMAAVLVRALKLEVPTETDNDASAWAKGYVQAAVNAGILSKDIAPKANATRSQMVDTAYAIYLDQQQPKVASYKVSENGLVVEFTLANSKVVKVTLEKALEPNKETEVKFSNDGYEYTEKVTWVVTDATKVQNVSANNLREVIVAFDGEVDAATAGDESNYSITGNAQTITVKSVALSSDKRTAVLTVDTGANNGLANQKEYKLSVTNVRAGSKVITATDVKFTPVDAALPVAQSAQALGNKAVKVTFSEPVQVANSSSFTIDGKTIVGTTEITGNVVILKLYNALENAEHTISVAGVQDYSTLKNISTDLKFTVVEDKAAPTVASVEKATFEEVTLKFSEPVDKATVLASNVYWMQGSDKRVASKVTAITDDTYKFEFVSPNKLVYTTDLYVVGVKDYSGNVIADNTKVQVNPVVDQTRPEVVNATLKDDRTNITVKFSKEVTKASAEKAENYVIKDADGKEVSKLKEAVRVDGKTVNVRLYQKLAEGKNFTLEIAGVADTTTLNNVMLPYSKQLSVGDTTAPTVGSATYVVADNKVIIPFSEVMATSGDGDITDSSKYSYKDDKGAWKTLPSGSYLNVSSDGKAVIIFFPSDVKVGTQVQGIGVSLVKDVAGNYIAGLQHRDEALQTAAPIQLAAGKVANATATNKIEVLFNQDLQSGSATASDFVVMAGATELAVSNADVDGDKVVLTLSDSNKLNADGTYGTGTSVAPVKVTVKAKGYLATPAGKQVDVEDTTTNAADKIAPAIKSVARATDATYAFNIEFTETVALGTNGQFDFDLKIGDKVLTAADFTVTPASGSTLTIKLDTAIGTANRGKVLDVRVKPYPSFIKDAGNNVIAGNDSFFSTYIQD